MADIWHWQHTILHQTVHYIHIWTGCTGYSQFFAWSNCCPLLPHNCTWAFVCVKPFQTQQLVSTVDFYCLTMASAPAQKHDDLVSHRPLCLPSTSKIKQKNTPKAHIFSRAPISSYRNSNCHFVQLSKALNWLAIQIRIEKKTTIKLKYQSKLALWAPNYISFNSVQYFNINSRG